MNWMVVLKQKYLINSKKKLVERILDGKFVIDFTENTCIKTNRIGSSGSPSGSPIAIFTDGNITSSIILMYSTLFIREVTEHSSPAPCFILQQSIHVL
jgi:hypothetical protein